MLYQTPPCFDLRNWGGGRKAAELTAEAATVPGNFGNSQNRGEYQA